MLSVSVFRHIRQTIPDVRRCSWSSLVKSLTSRRVVAVESKLDLPAWSPALYPDGAHRARGNVVSVSCIVLDYDDGTPMEVGVIPWRRVPYVAHTSWSHTPDAPRWRLVVPLASPIPAGGWARVWNWAHLRASRHPDAACKDPSRVYFVPAVRAPDWPFATIENDPEDRGFLDVHPDDLPETPDEIAARESKMRRRALEAEIAARPVTNEAGARRQVGDRLKVSPQARSDAARALGAALRGTGGDERATGVVCPQCERPAVWWPIEPRATPRAMCSHRQSCGWTGWLDDLLERRGALSAVV